MAEPTYCKCPAVGGFATISNRGACDRCGAEGPLHQIAIREALAAGNHQPAIDDAVAKARESWHRQGVIQGRAEVLEVLAEERLIEPYQRPFLPDLEAAG
jgi:hypothetical protein